MECPATDALVYLCFVVRFGFAAEKDQTVCRGRRMWNWMTRSRPMIGTDIIERY